MTRLLARDVDFSQIFPQLACNRYKFSIVLDFVMSLIVMSSAVILWFLTSV